MIERIGDIVRAVRERENCSLEALAHRSAVSVSVLAALEQGQPGITTTQLDSVAEALSLDPTALLSGREVPRRMPSVFLRHTPMQDFDDRDGAILDDALEQGRSLANLRSLLGEPALALQAGTFAQRETAADRPDAPAQDGYRLAREVRQWLGDTAEPLGDVATLLEARFGIAVLVRSLESSRVTAAGVRAESCAAIVLSATDHARARNPLLTRVSYPFFFKPAARATSLRRQSVVPWHWSTMSVESLKTIACAAGGRSRSGSPLRTSTCARSMSAQSLPPRSSSC